MHPALLIDEIFLIICQYLSDDKTLLNSLARSCKPLSDVALDELYAHIHSLHHLFMCLPKDLVQIERHEINFKRPIQTSDWAIFRRYAYRVRTLETRLHDPANLRVGESISLAMLRANDTPLLPCLHTLHWEWNPAYRAPLVDIVRVLVGPSLRVVSLIHIGLSDPTIIPMLVERMPALHSLSLSGFSSFRGEILNTLQSILTENLPRFAGLITFAYLDGPYIEPQLMSVISHLPKLECLRLSQPLYYDDPATNVSFTQFSKLRSLSMRGNGHATSWNKFVVSSKDGFPFLESLDLTFEINLIPSRLQDIASALASSPICELSLHPPCTLPLDHALTGDIFLPFTRFTQMQKVYLHSEGEMAIDDSHIATLATAWPDLRQLIMIANNEQKRLTSGVTFKGLCTLLRGCRQLHTFCLPLDLVQEPLTDTPVSELPRNYLITRMDIWGSAVADTDHVARCFSQMFPRLERIFCIDNRCDNKAWATFERLVRLVTLR
ncbi:hypothetical protein CONPUDRAFT_165392 [Coniophora puteana RWD-64-598 SS2]|uniref:F-box domain-containing protein n=1 Tax=Coniophora puteana (strain RWD-64-598) TaxID=741705 RepID=A0A5M3MPS7_CONPW|nr:uncharacterized protein CONPUDRAFT_165392 [Coniophora puteana RWD-64-598 SS2]EIW81178.1 hypothetical protein CONPUDRAFT_165392 [Coniophora puteana RWD-64-598 SS2]